MKNTTKLNNFTTIDLTDPNANMYGCFPCPKCKSRFRYGTQEGTVKCDDCGLIQIIIKSDE